MKTQTKPAKKRSRTTRLREAYREPSALAMRIARKLFTPSGFKDPVTHLRMYEGDRYVAGWSLYGAASAIERELDRPQT